MGIHVVIGARAVKAFRGDGHVRSVQLEDGRELPADLVVISAGVTPQFDLARQAGVATNRGIIVDEHMRTSDPQIYAAGDNAEFNGRFAKVFSSPSKGKAPSRVTTLSTTKKSLMMWTRPLQG